MTDENAPANQNAPEEEKKENEVGANNVEIINGEQVTTIVNESSAPVTTTVNSGYKPA